MENTYTLEEFKNYLLSQDSYGDAIYNLKHENVVKANSKCENCINSTFEPNLGILICEVDDGEVKEDDSCENFKKR